MIILLLLPISFKKRNVNWLIYYSRIQYWVILIACIDNAIVIHHIYCTLVMYYQVSSLMKPATELKFRAVRMKFIKINRTKFPLC